MDWHGLELVCPACRQELRSRTDSLVCTACQRAYPVRLGIPDLRLWPDPYIGFEEDRAKGEKLAQSSAGLSFADMVELYYQQTTVVPPFQAKAFTRALLAAADRAAHSLDRWEQSAAGDAAAATLLEIGCGTAPLLVPATRRYQRVAGVDIAFRWLVVARRRLEDAGVDVPLLCACAEALPFPDQVAERVVLDSAIELLRDARRGAEEAFRVLRPGGWLFLATPNRLSLGPDPHVGLWAGGWLPPRVLAAWVRARGAIPPERRLFSARSLRRLLVSEGFDAIEVYVPEVPAAQRAGFGAGLRRVIDAYNAGVRTPPGRALLRRIGPLLHATACKPSVRPAHAGDRMAAAPALPAPGA